MSLALAATLLAAAQSPTYAVPMAPSDKWLANMETDGCLLQRRYGTPDQSYVLGFRPWPMADFVEVVLLMPPSVGLPTEGYASVNLGKDQEPLKVRFQSAVPTINDKKRRAVITRVPVDNLAELEAAPSITFQFSRGREFAFALNSTKQAFGVLDTCKRKLMEYWKLDPSEADKIGTPARPHGDPTRWYPPSAYPSRASSENRTGRVIIFFEIGLDGRVSSCRTVDSSNVEGLDERSCSLMMRNGRFSPATDRDGKPMVSHQVEVIRWSLG